MKKINFNNKLSAHQGDIQIFSIDSIPANAKKIDNTFIAKSERSGHSHVLCGEYEMYEVEGSEGYFINVKGELAVLNHTLHASLTKEIMKQPKETPIADHKPTLIPEGIYYVGIQRRVNPFKKVWEKVQD